MLPEDTKKRKIVEKQPSVTEHFQPEDRAARPIPYSDKALETASLEWLIETNQVCPLYCFPSPVLIHRNMTANHHFQECRVQENARNCVTIQPRDPSTFAQAIKGSDHQDVQAPAVLAEGPPPHTFPLVLLY
jgi:hypothetical protein